MSQKKRCFHSYLIFITSRLYERDESPPMPTPPSAAIPHQRTRTCPPPPRPPPAQTPSRTSPALRRHGRRGLSQYLPHNRPPPHARHHPKHDYLPRRRDRPRPRRRFATPSRSWARGRRGAACLAADSLTSLLPSARRGMRRRSICFAL